MRWRALANAVSTVLILLYLFVTYLAAYYVFFLMPLALNTFIMYYLGRSRSAMAPTGLVLLTLIKCFAYVAFVAFVLSADGFSGPRSSSVTLMLAALPVWKAIELLTYFMSFYQDERISRSRKVWGMVILGIVAPLIVAFGGYFVWYRSVLHQQSLMINYHHTKNGVPISELNHVVRNVELRQLGSSVIYNGNATTPASAPQFCDGFEALDINGRHTNPNNFQLGQHIDVYIDRNECARWITPTGANVDISKYQPNNF